MTKNFRGADISITTKPERDALLSDFGKATLRDRYLRKDESYQDLFARVAAYYGDDQAHADRVYDYISSHWFMPATPILSNGGTQRGLPISCFLNSAPDTMPGIAAIWNENVALASNGGGIGTFWGDVRSIEEPIGKDTDTVGSTSGIIPFIKVQDSLTLAVSQGSLRRGSSATYVDDQHPEIEEFVNVRRPKGDMNRRSLNIHHGLMLSDAFMQAVVDDAPWDLRSPKDGSTRKTIQARDLWQDILLARLETGEPYIVFSDTVNRKNPAVYRKLGLKVKQSNLCSEIALHTGIDHLGADRTAVCCLASLNEVTMDSWYGNEQFLKDVAIFLDNVLTDFIDKTEDLDGFEKARYSAYRERSIGIGVMGFHSYLQNNNIPFESALAHAINLRTHKWLKATGEKINAEAALERGPCPDALDAGENVRWSHLFAVAPTASISIIASAGGVTSAGIEPVPANAYTHKTLSGSFEVRNSALVKVIERHARIRQGIFPEASEAEYESMIASFVNKAWLQIVEDQGSVKNLPFLSDDEKSVFKTAFEIDQRWVVSHAAARDPFIDQMASNNLFILPDVEKKDLNQLHLKAWRDGVSSLYYCRSKSKKRGGTKMDHMAGEMPQATPEHEVVLKDRGVKPEEVSGVSDDDDNRYEVCLACQ